MKLQKVLFWTGALVMVAANVAMAATSGTPMDVPVNQWGHFLTTTVAYSLTLGGVAGIADHALHPNSGMSQWTAYGGKVAIAGVAMHTIPATAVYLGMSSGALIY